jgi:outer membrane protein assembly factor BamB
VYGILPKGAAFGVDTPVIDANERAREPLSVWRAEVDDELWLSSLRAVADGVVVAERAGNVCMRGRANGESVWCLRVRGADGVEPAVFTTETQAFVVTPTAVTAIDARTGEEQWVQTGEWGDAVLGDGRLVVIAADGTVAALSIADGQAQTLHVTEGTGAPPATSEPASGSESLGASEPVDASASSGGSEPLGGGAPVGGGEPTVVAVDGDMLYAGLDDGALVSVDMAEQLVRR